jgi:bifunctional UDP-N-acetylglucosamine pyrophosphorylase / glucosamine-1-phosphate N-acetyltransferase
MPLTDTNFNTENSVLREQELAQLLSKVKKVENVIDKKLAVVILAAGLGKRMNSPDKPKVMFEINGRPMIDYVVQLAFKVNADVVVPIVGHHREQVIDFLNEKYKGKEIKYAVQAEQLGTGHAVMQTEDILKDFNGQVLILSGDVPLLKFETVQNLINEHFDKGNSATLLTTVFNESYGYGRIVRDEKGNFSKIVEQKDASDEEQKIKEINPAIYIVDSKVLFNALKQITPNNNQKEYYLTDIFHFIPKEKTGTVVTNDELEVTGVNSIEQLKEMENTLNSR